MKSLSFYTIERLKRVLIIAVITAIGISFFSFIEEGNINYIHRVLIIGFMLGVAVGFIEEFLIVKYFRNISLFKTILIKGILYTFSVAIIYIGYVWFHILIGEIGYSYLWSFLSSIDFLKAIFYTLLVFDIVVVFNQYLKLLGSDLVFLYAYGKYQQPEHERRIFMFLDISSSTELAETMNPDNYFSFINEFFHDISEPLLKSSAHIYQYVGDEVVFTWKIKQGIKQNNCVNLFFLISEVINKKQDFYLQKYGQIPKFKAGLHCGEVIAAVVGDIKKELIYNGDVLNTTSRIRSYCTEVGEDFLASSDLISKLSTVDEHFEVKSLGIPQLKGKKNIVGLFSIKNRLN